MAILISCLVELHDFLPNIYISRGKEQSTKNAPYKIVENVYTGWNKNNVAFLLMMDI